ncbi:baseplate J/gp47 family protein [Paraburkholderia antibiotica]|uniref:Baseplate assembly protein n=1 Tax=Paraburkholderia antibiotica TaxID=2728839 RepID=A0A7X9X5E3_9BURK|nr:baseplate J/gp47 family protein [Paraburkholderia antibiotica]NML31783.1 baseplate assembly protein [Paraburkholderia antibiotica]
MSTAPIDLSRLPAPDIVEQIDFEAALAERKAGLIALMPEDRQAEVAATLELESEPLAISLQESVYREIYLIQKINDKARGILLAFARGTTLEHLAAFFDVERLEITAADPETGAAAVMEEDDDLRYRTQLAPQGFSVAGPELAYLSHARGAHGDVLDASSISPEPGDVVVTVLSRKGDGTPDQSVLDAVSEALNDEDVRPITDNVIVQGAEIVRYGVIARIRPFSGPDSSVALQNGLDRLATYLATCHRLGRTVARSGIDAALHVEGIERVTLISPADDITTAKVQAPWCDPADVDVAIEDPNDD